MKELSEKIQKLNQSIIALESHSKIDSYSKALECYYEIKYVVLEIFKIQFSFLYEPILKSLINAMCDCAGDIDLLEESKVSERSLLVAGGIYEKSFSLMSFCYTSENKVNELESNIHDLYKVARDNFKMVNEFKLKYYECKEVRAKFKQL